MHILQHIFYFILKALIPLDLSWSIVTTYANIKYPYVHKYSMKLNLFFPTTITFSYMLLLTFLGIVDVMKSFSVNNSVVRYFTEQHHMTLISYIKNGMTTSTFTTVVFLAYLIFIILYTIVQLRNEEAFAKKLLEKDVKTVEI